MMPHLLSALLLSLHTLAADTDAWKSRTIYLALTDRIARNSTDGRPCENLADYCGGTFRGLASRLDYIKGLGFDAVWVTPVVANKKGGYHGYWAEDLYAVNPNHGSADDLRALVDAAHARDMYVMVDVVVNHMGPGDVARNRPEPLNSESAYHAPCAIDYGNQGSLEHCRVAGLPDVKTEDPGIRTLYEAWVRWLVSRFGFDGIRIDTVKHVEKAFWPPFAAAAGVFSIGEVLDGSPDYLAGYAGVLPGLLNYAVYGPLRAFYQQRGPSQALINAHDAVGSRVRDAAALGTFLDNHDNPRWLSTHGDAALLRNALAYVLLARGIPVLYYGTEQAFAGGADPANREDLWRSGFGAGDLYRFIARLASVRKAAGGLPGDDHRHLLVEDTAYAWSRAGGDVIVLTSNVGSRTSWRYCLDTRRPRGGWRSAFGGEAYEVDAGGRLCANVVNGEPVILISK